jgi:hypothetical protein
VKSNEWLSLSVPEFLTTIESALSFEDSQGQFYYPGSRIKFIQDLERELITTHIETLIKVIFSNFIYSIE